VARGSFGRGGERRREANGEPRESPGVAAHEAGGELRTGGGRSGAARPHGAA